MVTRAILWGLAGVVAVLAALLLIALLIWGGLAIFDFARDRITEVLASPPGTEEPRETPVPRETPEASTATPQPPTNGGNQGGATPPVAIGTCPQINGMMGSPIPVGCKYFAMQPVPVTVPQGWFADAYIPNQGAVYGQQPGTQFTTVEMTLKPLPGGGSRLQQDGGQPQTAAPPQGGNQQPAAPSGAQGGGASAPPPATTGGTALNAQNIVQLVVKDATQQGSVTCNKQESNYVCSASGDVTVTHPGNGVQIDYWGGFPAPANAGSCNVTSTQAEHNVICDQSGATFQADKWTVKPTPDR